MRPKQWRAAAAQPVEALHEVRHEWMPPWMRLLLLTGDPGACDPGPQRDSRSQEHGLLETVLTATGG